MSVEHSRPAVGVAATVVARAIGTTEQISVQNPSAVSVFLGGAGVTTASYGYELAPMDTFAADLPPGAVLHGVVATTTASVNVLHIGLGA